MFFIFKYNQVIARDMHTYINFPGGGTGDNESIKIGAAREVLGEVGALVSGLKIIKKIYFIWTPSWTSTKKENSDNRK